MKKRIIIGLTVGLVAGILDVIPMLIQKLTWDANLSALSLWIVVGFLLATSDLHLPAVLKGIVIAYICLLPSVFIIGWNNPVNLIPVLVMTGILGALVGAVFHKLVKE
jgi:CHASE2 domain-containing sensor protein